jgi:hypothetical protein
MDHAVTTDPTTAEERDTAERRDQVRRLLWQACDEAGMKRPKGLTVDAWDAVRRRLTQRLDHLDAENLRTLAELVQDNAVRGETYPSEVVIWHLAQGLQKRPIEEARIVTSWLASIEGPPAMAGGYEVELFWFLRRTGRPPMPHDMIVIRNDAADNARAAGFIRERIARGTARPADRAWLEDYMRAKARVAAIVAGGAARREPAEVAG